MRIYTLNSCNFCKKSKELLQSRNIEYTEINIEESAYGKKFLKDFGYKTVPQIWTDDGTHIGGYEELVEHLLPKRKSSVLDSDMNISVMRDAAFYKKPQ